MSKNIFDAMLDYVKDCKNLSLTEQSRLYSANKCEKLINKLRLDIGNLIPPDDGGAKFSTYEPYESGIEEAVFTILQMEVQDEN